MNKIHQTPIVTMVIILSLLAGFGTTLAEDTPEPSSTSNARRWSVYLGVGTKARIHTAEDFKAGMTEGGYVDGSSNSIPGWYSGTYQASPTGYSNSPVLHGAVGYDAGKNWGCRLFFNSGEFVEANGRDVNTEINQERSIFAKASLTTVGLLAVYQFSPGLRLGAGPSFHRFIVDYTDYLRTGDDVWSTTSQSETQAHNQLGFTFEGMLTVPARSKVFFFLGYQRHYIMKFDIGPFAAMPATSASINHSVWLLGLGLRF